VLEYGEKFWKAYENEKKFLYLEFMDGHEGTGEVVRYLDAPLVKMLENINLEDTTIIVFSDHGWHMHSIYYLLDIDVYSIE
jgi:predicted AlkP superfamily phosphohydrolase/phosphomutase